MKFTVNDTLIGKRIQTLDGKAAKITGVTNTGYNIEGQRKAVRVWQVTRVGGKLVQVEGSKADAQDTGKGYVTYEEKKVKTDKKEKKVDSTKKDDSAPKSSDKKAKKVKEAELDEEDDEADRVTLTSIDKNSAELIRTAVRDAVRGVLDCMFTNSCEITTSVMITPEDKDKIAVNMGIAFELPEVEEEDYVAEFEMSPATAKLYLAGKWESMVEGNSTSIAKICEALQEDDAESIVHGARLVHEDGSVIFFVGVSKDKRLLAQDEEGQPLTVSIKDLMDYEVQAVLDDEELDLGDDDEELDLGDDDEELDLGDDDDAEDEDEDTGEKSREVCAFEDKVEEIYSRSPATALKFVAKQDRKLVLTSIDTTFDIGDDLAEELAELDSKELAEWYIDNVYESDDGEEEEEEELDEEEEEEDDSESESEFDFEVSDEDDELDDEEEDDLDDEEDDLEEEEDDLDDEEDNSEMIESVRTEKSVKNLVKMCHNFDIKFKKSLLANPKEAVKVLRSKIINYLEA